jgi:peptidoglycan hydrolase-like protein with peptidoglycan-binding domain
MASNHLSADLTRYALPRGRRAPNRQLWAWIGVLGGGTLALALAVLVAAELWQRPSDDTPQLSAAELKEAESLLKQLGFPPGPVDGVIDEQSREAIRDFQLTDSLTVDGQLNVGLLNELRTAKAEFNEISAPLARP